MAKDVEKELQEWFEKMEASPGIYDGLRLIDEDCWVGPQERLQEMFLKRLNGFNIALAVTDTEEFGSVIIDGMNASIDFNIERLRENGMTSVLPFTSDRGITGTVRLDWQSCTMIFVQESGEQSIYVVNEFLQNWTIFGTGHKFDMGFLCVISPLLDDGAPKQGFLDNLSLNKMYVEGLIFAERKPGKSFNPQTTVTFKEVSDVTGVPASTLSNIRTGKKSLDNLTWKTMSVLSFYAQIRMLDMHIIDMLRQQLSGAHDERQAELKAEKDAESQEDRESLNAEWIATHGQDFELRCVVVSLRDGTSYKLDGGAHKPTEALYEHTVAAYNDDLPSMNLKFAVTDAGEKLHRVMVPKVDVHHIRMDRYKPYADVAV